MLNADPDAVLQVAKDMQTHRRTSAQCLQRYTKILTVLKKGAWEPVEKLQLACAVRGLSIVQRRVNWGLLASAGARV